MLYRRVILIAASVALGFGVSVHHEPSPYAFAELRHFPEMPLSEVNPITNEGVKLGRFLFYDPILSADSTVSCASCHRQAAAFSDGPKRFSRGLGADPTTRNTMPLFNLAWYPSLFWDGKAASIEDQVFHPVRAHAEMNLSWSEAAQRLTASEFYRPLFASAFGYADIDSVLIAKAIAQFERTLISHNSKYDRVLRMEDYFTSEEYEGFILMNDQTKGDCLHCHTTDADALGTTTRFSNNGLDVTQWPSGYSDLGRGGITGKEADYGHFRIPSLRNLAFTAPYMHDGRFATLEEVIDFYSGGVNQSYNIDPKMEYAHQGGVRLNPDEKASIVAFLKTMSDSTFITNPDFGNPFHGE